MLPLMQGAFLLALVRHWLLRLARGRGVSWPGHPWVASAIVIAVFAMIVMRTAVDATYPLLDVASFVVTGSIILSVIQRLGLFAGIVAFFVFFVSGSVPWTVDPSNVYSGPVFAVAALLIAMAATGFWLARAGEPLFAPSEP
jgi:cytochrome b subunit of formate dehydrogenase